MAVEIPLRKRDGTIAAVAIVDEEDAHLVRRFYWHLSTRGYAMRSAYLGRTNGKGRSEGHFMHRQILGLKSGDRHQVDHINRDKLDNRRQNLRLVTQAENNQNVVGGYGRSGIRGAKASALPRHRVARRLRSGLQCRRARRREVYLPFCAA
jgi:hypothetical protein